MTKPNKKSVPNHHDKKGMTSMLIWEIPKSIKRRYKLACTLKGETIHNNIIEHMRKFTEISERDYFKLTHGGE